MRKAPEILIVEDSRTQREHLRHLLEGAGYQVAAAENGQMALDMIDSGKIRPGIVVSDVVMPVLDGFAFCRNLKSRPEWSKTPVVLVTDLDGPDNVIKSLECGADNFITKPYNDATLANRINYLLINHEMRSQQQSRLGLEIEIGGRRHLVTSERQQILDLLLSTYDEAAHLNQSLREKQEALTQSYRQLDELFAVTRALNECRTLEEVAGCALDALATIEGIEKAWLVLVDGAGMRLMAGGTTEVESANQFRPALCECLRAATSMKEEPVVSIDACDCCDLGGPARLPRKHQSIPLRVGGEVVGAISFTSTEGADRTTILDAIGRFEQQFASALARARLHDELDRRVQQKTAELIASEQRFRDFSEVASDWLWETDSESRFTYFSNSDLADLPEGSSAAVRPTTTHEIIDPCFQDGEALFAAVADRLPFRNLLCRRCGATEIYFRVSGKPIWDSAGSFVGYRGVAANVTSETKAKLEIERTRRLLSDAFESIPAGLLLYDKDERFVMCNTWYRAQLGSLISEALVPGATAELLFHLRADELAPPDSDSPEAKREWVKRRLSYFRNPQGVFEIRTSTGTIWEVVERRTSDGGTLSLRTDVTVRRALEDSIRQSEKLSAVGRLTGGVAHDFNNILMVILACVDALEEDESLSTDVRERILEIGGATQRAAALTRQLLAFSRKQALQPQRTNINELVVTTSKLLRRTLGEQIEIDTALDEEVWEVNVDRAQVEAALVNLSINARDAMPEGGRLLIETRNVVLDRNSLANSPDVMAGEFVMLSVTDTGMGMTPEVRSQVFEPFFTTKEVGKGTGLGLSMVYGFVKQSNGHIDVRSEPGRGTTFRLYLPRAGDVQEVVQSTAAAATSGGHERILVVEDDPKVRANVVRQLMDLGYSVDEAPDGVAGLATFEAASQPYDLLLTDVIMPGALNGRMLADTVGERWPACHILFMSGYSDNAIIHQGRLDKDVLLLSKPFRKADLARMVRQALSGQSSPIA
jgi:signal transduction histidine kinase/DNA-binding response OmpR family regulator